MDIHEYQAKQILREFGVCVATGELANSADEAVAAAFRLGGEAWAIKAQVHAGGRGLGGGVKLARNLDEVKQLANRMINMRLITPQTPKNGKLVRKIYVERVLKFEREIYVSLAFDRANEKIALIVCKNGGMSIEQVARERAELILRLLIDPSHGIEQIAWEQVGEFLAAGEEIEAKFRQVIDKLYQIYIQKEATLIEINPLVLGEDGEFYALDAKMSFDDSALFRHADIAMLRDESESEPSEVEAKKSGLSYVKLDGNVGCIVNGAGLAMATMDVIASVGGRSANFLDVGGAANPESVAKGCEIILRDENVRAIFVNIFGGIVRCERIAQGLLAALRELDTSVAIVVRFDGTNAREAMDALKEANLPNLHVVQNLLEGARLAVKLAKI